MKGGDNVLTYVNPILESFSEINRAIYKLLKAEADKAGITVVQLKALFRISMDPDMSLSELSEKLRLTNSTVSGVIDRLVHSEIVERTVPPENRRSISIHLTEKGERLLEKLTSEDSIFVQKIENVMNIPEDEIKQLLHLHKLVLSKLSLEEETD